MWRIYVESLIGLVTLFVISLMSYEYIVFELNPDHELVLEEYRFQALRDMVNETATLVGEPAALRVLQDYTTKVHEVLATNVIEDTPKDVQSFFTQNESANTYIDADDVWWFTLDNNELLFSLSINEDSELIQAVWFGQDLVWPFFFVGFAFYCMVLIYFLSRRVRRLEQVTLRFAAGDFSARVSEKSGHRVGRLNRNFNHMADKISALIMSNKALTNAVAHELRTPIFRIQWQAEVLSESLAIGGQSGADNLDKNQAAVSSIIEDTEEMDELVDELLYYAKVERPDAALNYMDVDINGWLSEQVAKWQKGHQVEIQTELLPSAKLARIDPSLIARAVANLVRNALRYAESTVMIQLSQQEGSFTFTVHDDGAGVSKDHWAMLFEPFYRADKSRDKKLGGYGLGLAIVKQIAQRHGGTIEVGTSQRLGGACFTLTICVGKPE